MAVPRMRQSLTDAKIRKAKSGSRPFKLADGGRLFVLVNPNGSKLWRWRYEIGGRERLLALGSYPAVSLQEARRLRDEARTLVKRGVDPVAHRRAEKARADLSAATTFAVVAAEYVAGAKAKGRAPKTILKMEQLVRRAATLANRPIADISSAEILTLLKSRTHATAVTLRGFLGSIFRFAIANGFCQIDPVAPLQGAIAVPPQKHYPAIIDAKGFGALLRALDACQGGLPQVGIALRLAPHLALRPTEWRCGRWSEIDFDKAVWVIPASRMKKRREHAVPLSRQVLEILTELRAITGNGEFLFPGRAGQCLSEQAPRYAMEGLGYKGVHSLHGFRTSFSSMANVSGLWSEDAIERQLAHADRNSIRGVYSRDAFWPERQRLMQWWSDRIDEMRNPIKPTQGSPLAPALTKPKE